MYLLTPTTRFKKDVRKIKLRAKDFEKVNRFTKKATGNKSQGNPCGNETTPTKGNLFRKLRTSHQTGFVDNLVPNREPQRDQTDQGRFAF